jgi:HEAT repeat protein
VLWAAIVALLALGAYSLLPLWRVHRAYGVLANTVAVEQRNISRECRYCGARLAFDAVAATALDDAMETLSKMDMQAVALPLLIDALKSENDELRHGAVLQIARMGTQAKEALPALVQSHGDPHRPVVEKSMLALNKFGVDGVPFLIEALDQASLCERVCESIGRLGSAAEPAIPRLLRLIDNDAEFKNVTERLAAGEALVQLGAAAVPGLVDRLLTPDEYARASNGARNACDTAEWALGEIGEPAIPALIGALGRGVGSYSLSEIGRPAIPALVEALKSDDALVRAESRRALEKIAERYSDEVLPILKGTRH